MSAIRKSTKIIREVKLCDEDRAILSRILRQSDYLGNMTPEQHIDQHNAYSELLPWLISMRKEQEARAAFWSRLVSENIIKAVGIVLIAGAIALVLGWSRAIHWIMRDAAGG